MRCEMSGGENGRSTKGEALMTRVTPGTSWDKDGPQREFVIHSPG